MGLPYTDISTRMRHNVPMVSCLDVITRLRDGNFVGVIQWYYWQYERGTVLVRFGARIGCRGYWAWSDSHRDSVQDMLSCMHDVFPYSATVSRMTIGANERACAGPNYFLSTKHNGRVMTRFQMSCHY